MTGSLTSVTVSVEAIRLGIWYGATGVSGHPSASDLVEDADLKNACGLSLVVQHVLGCRFLWDWTCRWIVTRLEVYVSVPSSSPLEPIRSSSFLDIEQSFDPLDYTRRYIFAGSLTILWSFIVLLVLPDSPTNPGKFFRSPEERRLLHERLESNMTGKDQTGFKWGQVREAVGDVKIWLFLCMG